MGKVYKALVINPNGIEQFITVTAKNAKDCIRKLEIRNYKVKETVIT